MRALQVLVIGAGFSGICAAIKLYQAGFTEFEVIEKGDGIGGTWRNNTYPGATCDVPSHFYCFSFAPNPDWSHLYSAQSEILSYLEACVKRFDVGAYFRFETAVTKLTYDEARLGWIVEFDNAEPVFARFVINGMGMLHRPSWPDIPGCEIFQGKKMHTAAWDAAFDPKGKRIAVIGSAASAIQVIPQLAKTAAQVDVYQRTPNYIAPRGNFRYGQWQKRAFRWLPFWQRLYRHLIFSRMDKQVFPLIVDSEKRAELTRQVHDHLQKAINDPELRAHLTPDYELGCKRILISDDFYPSLNRKNVALITERVERITATGIRCADGGNRDADAIVFATGFDIQSQFFALDVIGPGGRTLSDAWRDRVEAYRGVMVSGFPNYFTTMGPNTAVGTTSAVHMLEQSLNWILHAITATRDSGTVDVTPEAQDDYNARIQDRLSATVWAGSCHSWYKRPDGRIETLYPGNAAEFAREMKKIRRGDLVFSDPAHT